MPLTKLSYHRSELLQLGFSQTALYAVYKFGLLSGHYKRVTPIPADSLADSLPSYKYQPLFDLPTRLTH